VAAPKLEAASAKAPVLCYNQKKPHAEAWGRLGFEKYRAMPLDEFDYSGISVVSQRKDETFVYSSHDADDDRRARELLFAQIDQLDEPDCDDTAAPATSEISPLPSRSKTAERRIRRSPSRDRHFLSELNDLDRRKALREFRATSVKAPTPLSLHTPDPDLLERIKAVKARYLTPQVKGYLKRQFPEHKHPPLWEKATPVLKSHYWQQSVSEAGGVPFVVNFNPDVIARAEGSAKGAFTVLRDRVRDALKAEFGQAMDFWCALDTDADGRLHIHGGIIASPQDRDRLRNALKRAGGRWTHKRGEKRQVWIGEHGDSGWGTYSVRNNDAVRQQVGQRGVYASGSIKRRAEALYGQDRRELVEFQRLNQ
jgi:hypothetical protein